MDHALNALTAGDQSAGDNCLALGLAMDPTDSRFQLMSAVLAQAQGRINEGFNHLCRALTAELGLAMNLNELCCTTCGTAGGRQRLLTGQWRAPDRTRIGLKVLCGNGHGSHRVSSLGGAWLVWTARPKRSP